VGVGERAAQKLVADLVADGYISRVKEGRRNRYEVDPTAHLVIRSSRMLGWACTRRAPGR
jgi:predicted transcriptional regulator